MKSGGTSIWNAPNKGATNISGLMHYLQVPDIQVILQIPIQLLFSGHQQPMELIMPGVIHCIMMLLKLPETQNSRSRVCRSDV